MCKTLLPLKLLVDADDWPFFDKTKLIFYIFCSPCPKNVPAPLADTLCPLFQLHTSQALSQEFVTGKLIWRSGAEPLAAGGHRRLEVWGKVPSLWRQGGLGVEFQHSAIFQKKAYLSMFIRLKFLL